ncbi:hypothetical protein PRZ48_011490 [Zasmidium cellare]|uniref:Uncharacterized protein n=1 Tax=Zasmidium cellare TaxID=395010 RepID=A0ABR0E6I7_ZASCE|nr:hypothetical protein PRZ48_011490 [Zasmidium cellare]
MDGEHDSTGRKPPRPARNTRPARSTRLDYGDDPESSPETATDPSHHPDANMSSHSEPSRDVRTDTFELIHQHTVENGFVSEDFKPLPEVTEALRKVDWRYFTHPEFMGLLAKGLKAPADNPEAAKLVAGASKGLFDIAAAESNDRATQSTDLFRDLGFPEDDAVRTKPDRRGLRAGQCIYGLILEFMRSSNIRPGHPRYVASRAGPMILKCYRMIVRYIIGDYAYVNLCVTKEDGGWNAVKESERDLFLKLFGKGSDYVLPEGCLAAVFSDREEKEASMVQRVVYRVHLDSMWRMSKSQLTPDSIVRLCDVDMAYPIDRPRIEQSLKDMPDETVKSLRDLGMPNSGQEIIVEEDGSVRLFPSGLDSASEAPVAQDTPPAMEDVTLASASIPGAGEKSSDGFRSPIKKQHPLGSQSDLWRRTREQESTFDDESTVPGAQNDSHRGSLAPTADDDTVRGRKRPAEDDAGSRNVKAKLDNDDHYDARKRSRSRRDSYIEHYDGESSPGQSHNYRESHSGQSRNSRQYLPQDPRDPRYGDRNEDLGFNPYNFGTRREHKSKGSRHHSFHSDRDKDSEKHSKRSGRSKSRKLHRGGSGSVRNGYHDGGDRNPRDREDGRKGSGK